MVSKKEDELMTLRLSKKEALRQLVGVVVSVIAAVGLPQVLHLIGFGLGEIILPMHLPVLLAGFVVGPYAGAVCGLLSPIISYLLTGMPQEAMLPFIVIELITYGFMAGMLKNVQMPNVLKVLSCQIGGRIIRGIAIILIGGVSATVIWSSIVMGLVGIILQLILIPKILDRYEGLR